VICGVNSLCEANLNIIHKSSLYVYSLIFNSEKYGSYSSIAQQLLKLKISYFNINGNKVTMIKYIDLKQEFPSINFNNLLDDPKNIGIFNKELNWFLTYIHNMKHYTYFNNIKSDDFSKWNISGQRCFRDQY
jgi:hypothetical protein